MAGYPQYKITMNAGDSHQTVPEWLVLFVRFKEPTSMYNGDSAADLMAVKALSSSMVENDCVEATISGGKGDFNKSCTLRLKVTDTLWQDAVSPGDYVFVWVSPIKAEIDALANFIRTTSPSQFGNKLCRWDSGLKFYGRIVKVGSMDVTSAAGVKSYTQSITCQAFLELATSVYYTYVGATAPNITATPSGEATPQATALADELRQKVMDTRMDRALKNIADKFLSIYQTKKELTPDSLVGYLFALIMGVPNDPSGKASGIDQISGAVSDAIRIPAAVGDVLGRSGARYMWELYNLYLGVQKYDASRPHPWQSFMPRFVQEDTGNKFRVFWRSPGDGNRCKGISPFYPPMWSNETMWTILNQYLNPTVNEMYTALRVNYDNTIGPTLVVREKPFSTGLFTKFVNAKVVPLGLQTLDQQNSINAVRQLAEKSDDGSFPDETLTVVDKGSSVADLVKAQVKSFTYFSNVPRWVIDRGMIRDISTSCSESRRINFVQVWGRNGSAEFMGVQIDPKTFRQSQIAAGNAVSDDKDIQRNGLRADISESQWDFFSGGTASGSLAPLWAKMRADWMFNGHLKLFGTITCNGIKEPICEGDNVQVNGIVYHIEGVDHRCALENGRRSFTTVLTVSHGVLARRLNQVDPPLYAIHRGISRSAVPLPAATILQQVPGKEEGT